MLERLHDAVIATAVRGGARGMTMGSLVDALETEGFEVGHIELAVWELLRQGRLLPTGFVCRTIRKRDETGAAYETRAYELLLAAEPDQLELELEGRR